MDGLDPEGMADSWQRARAAYVRLLDGGIEASDQALSRDAHYHAMLMAGLAILRSGGHGAVSEARSWILSSVPEAEARHFQRLWNGLLVN